MNNSNNSKIWKQAELGLCHDGLTDALTDNESIYFKFEHQLVVAKGPKDWSSMKEMYKLHLKKKNTFKNLTRNRR